MGWRRNTSWLSSLSMFLIILFYIYKLCFCKIRGMNLSLLVWCTFELQTVRKYLKNIKISELGYSFYLLLNLENLSKNLPVPYSLGMAALFFLFFFFSILGHKQHRMQWVFPAAGTVHKQAICNCSGDAITTLEYSHKFGLCQASLSRKYLLLSSKFHSAKLFYCIIVGGTLP